MSVPSINRHHLNIHSAEDIHELFRLLGYDVYEPYPYEGAELEQLELDKVDEDRAGSGSTPLAPMKRLP